jgi:hypothetical protein
MRMRPLMVAVLVLLVGAQSQGPAPRSGESRKPQQAQAPSGRQQPTKNQRGTEESPLTVASRALFTGRRSGSC